MKEAYDGARWKRVYLRIVYIYTRSLHDTIDNDCIATTIAAPIITDNDITSRGFSNLVVQHPRRSFFNK